MVKLVFFIFLLVILDKVFVILFCNWVLSLVRFKLWVSNLLFLLCILNCSCKCGVRVDKFYVLGLICILVICNKCVLIVLIKLFCIGLIVVSIVLV